jgi:molybdopterin synthase catalytic subunit
VRVRVLAFARLRDVFGFGERECDVPAGTTLEALWDHLALDAPDAPALRASTRFARNGVVAEALTGLTDGDEVALLPPVGGG